MKWLVGFILNVAREFAKKRGRDATSPPEDGGPGLDALAVDPSRPVDDTVPDRLLADQKPSGGSFLQNTRISCGFAHL